MDIPIYLNIDVEDISVYVFVVLIQILTRTTNSTEKIERYKHHTLEYV